MYYMNYGGGDHKLQTRVAYGRSSQSNVCGRRLSLRLINYSPVLSDVQRRFSCSNNTITKCSHRNVIAV